MPKFIGGCADGTVIEVQNTPLTVHIAHRLSMKEMLELSINAVVSWKPPEDVYYLKDGDYVFDRMINYKPPVSPGCGGVR